MANKRNIFVIYIIALCNLHTTVYGLRSFVMEQETVKYEFNSDIVKFMEVKLFNYKNHNALNATLSLLEDVHQFDIVSWVSVTRANGKAWTVFNVTLNGCQFLENTLGKTNPVMAAFLKDIRKYAPNLPKKCPYKKNIEYTTMNYYLNEDMFPVYLPEVDFRGFIGATRQKIYIFKLFTTGYIAAKNGQKYRNRTMHST